MPEETDWCVFLIFDIAHDVTATGPELAGDAPLNERCNHLLPLVHKDVCEIGVNLRITSVTGLSSSSLSSSLFVASIRAAVMAITKCLISAQMVTPVTVAATALRQRVFGTSLGWSALAYMEKIMSETKHTEHREYRELAVQEIELVSGGMTKEEEAAREVAAVKAFAKAIQTLQAV